MDLLPFRLEQWLAEHELPMTVKFPLNVGSRGCATVQES